MSQKQITSFPLSNEHLEFLKERSIKLERSRADVLRRSLDFYIKNIDLVEKKDSK